MQTPRTDQALMVMLARSEAEVRAAQRLRWRVFVEELGARLESSEPGLDSDRFDAHCDHLLVRETATGDVVGTYRMLPPERVARAGGFYAESEFHLTRLVALRRRMVEVGRACVRRDHRTGGVISLLCPPAPPLERTPPLPLPAGTRVSRGLRQHRARRRHDPCRGSLPPNHARAPEPARPAGVPAPAAAVRPDGRDDPRLSPSAAE